jgi:hypothetical protein
MTRALTGGKHAAARIKATGLYHQSERERNSKKRPANFRCVSISVDQELCRLVTACVPVHEMNIVGTFIKGLARCQRHFLPTFYLHQDCTLQDVNVRMCIVSVKGSHAARRID